MYTLFKNKFRLLTFRNKISIHFLIIITLLASISYFTIIYFEKELKKTYFSNLSTINTIKKSQIEHYFNHHEKELATLESLPFVLKASQELIKSYNTDRYKKIYIKYHKMFKNYLQYQEFKNVFIVDIKTDHIVFALNDTLKNKDITSKIYEKTNFQQLYYSMMMDKGLFKLADFDFFTPSNGEPAAFYATPIFDNKLNIISILFIQISIDEINKIITGNKNWEKEGLGKTGETFLVASDCKIRSDSRSFIENKDKYFKTINKTSVDENTIELIHKYDTNILLHPINKEKCEKILKTKSEATMIHNDFKGTEVLLSYSPIDIEGVNWYIVSQIEKDEAFKLISSLKTITILTLIVLIIVLAITTFIFTKAITKPINQIIEAFEELGKGNFIKKLNIESTNEFHNLSKIYNKAIDDLQKLTFSVEKLSIISSTDYLTKIYNRQKFLEELKENITRIKRTKENLSLAMIDIDFFKRINDTYGHNIGDLVLKQFTNIIKNELRQSDIFARWGGEEFIILFINTDINQAKVVSEKIRKSIEKTKFNHIDKLTCSIGVSQYKNTKEESVNSFIERSDIALYKAKTNGRNQISCLK